MSATHLVKSPRVRTRVALGEIPAGSEGMVEVVLGAEHQMVVSFEGLGRQTCSFGDLEPSGTRSAPTRSSARVGSRGRRRPQT